MKPCLRVEQLGTNKAVIRGSVLLPLSETGGEAMHPLKKHALTHEKFLSVIYGWIRRKPSYVFLIFFNWTLFQCQGMQR